MYRNAEHYAALTEGKAIAHVMAEMRRAKRREGIRKLPERNVLLQQRKSLINRSRRRLLRGRRIHSIFSPGRVQIYLIGRSGPKQFK